MLHTEDPRYHDISISLGFSCQYQKSNIRKKFKGMDKNQSALQEWVGGGGGVEAISKILFLFLNEKKMLRPLIRTLSDRRF